MKHGTQEEYLSKPTRTLSRCSLSFAPKGRSSLNPTWPMDELNLMAWVFYILKIMSNELNCREPCCYRAIRPRSAVSTDGW